HLSERQEEVAIMIMQGFPNRKIAERLFISELTVKDHLQNIFEKTGVHTRSELIAKVLNLNVEEAK
ncbi:MAG: helix-turn-helix transcriptional regulator, partial [Candidatus Firestonebacteria bacterium]|nr:helix-turn-helix transcriptional regulator [Candidatus Firestonebacteria bacterium]